MSDGVTAMIPTLLLAATIVAGEAPVVDFDTQVVPILTKAGCNAGACHGSAVGRGGFKLSLYGGNPGADYDAIALELESRRVNLTTPTESLLYMKPTGWLDHGGGERFDDDGAAASLMLSWIGSGARRDQIRALQDFEVTPAHATGLALDSTIELRALARFDDGTAADVTAWTVFTAEDPAAVEIDENSRAVLHRRGRHLVVARYLDRVTPIELIVPLSDKRVDLSNASRHNFIDEFVYDKLQSLNLPVSPPADDATLVRRLYLDACGRLPTPDEVLDYQAATASDKREQLIERLLQSESFQQYWTYRFARLLRIRSQPQESRGARTYHEWLARQIAEGTPFDEVARKLLTAEGDTHEYGPANFYIGVGGAREQAEFVSELLLGVRLRCANCHNHPLDRWTQDDYHGLAALFAGIERGRVVRAGGSGTVTHPRTGEDAVPRIPGVRFLEDSDDGRAQLADWVTDPNNPFFARATVNRIWSALLGRGLVNPTDDLRETNPATHPELLDALARDFVEHGFDLRHEIRLICNSETYARSALPLEGNRSDDRFYSHAIVRPLEPEVLADALADVTGVADAYGEESPGTRAVTLFDARIPSEALDILGRCSREESCETPVADAGGLALKLHLVNGELINRKVSHSDGRLSELINAGTSAGELVELLYLLGLSRQPTNQERSFWTSQFADTSTDEEFRELAEDFLWGLLTSKEFATNH